jgi:hydroxymethylglutaryl-CoA reductase (NADPH)
VAELPAIPRDRDDDLAPSVVEARRKIWSAASGREAKHVFGAPVPPEAARAKVENFVGFAQVPLGIAGPLRVDTSAGVREVYVPMATTEGAMVASYSRGMKLLNSGPGCRARVIAEGLTQNPILVYASAREAIAASEVAMKSLADLARIVAGTTRHGRLVGIRPEVVGHRLIVSLVFTTGDAIGINMAARAADLCSAQLAKRTGALERYVHGQDVEKRANARAFAEGRGRRAIAEATVPRAQLARLARTTPEALVAILASYTVGFAGLGTQNWLVQSANGLAAVMIACGQDVAYVTESSMGVLDFDVDPRGDLRASASLPALLVGTVGGGTGQGTARECLELLGCTGDGSANVFAEILAATVLAGDLSLMASFCAHEFVDAHERLGRNRPQSGRLGPLRDDTPAAPE